MRASAADSDGIIHDAAYAARAAQWEASRWRVFQPFVDKVRARAIPWKRKLRTFLEVHHRAVSLAFAPAWLPLWYLNSRVLHLTVLDFVGRTSNVLFRKPA